MKSYFVFHALVFIYLESPTWKDKNQNQGIDFINKPTFEPQMTKINWWREFNLIEGMNSN